MLNLSNAQNPFQSIGKEVPVLTLSNGQYMEFHPNDSLRQIGSVIVNVRTGKIYSLLSTNTPSGEIGQERIVASRWFSVDPLAAKYPMLSPYSFCNNNPIKFVDFDGRDFGVNIDHNKQTITITTEIITTSKDFDRLAAATNFIKEQANGKFVYVWQDDLGNSHSYDIVFEFDVKSQSPPAGFTMASSNKIFFDKDPSNIQNTFDVIDDTDNNKADDLAFIGNTSELQSTKESKYIYARKSLQGKMINDNATSGLIENSIVSDAHEIISHILGRGKSNMGGAHTETGTVGSSAAENSGSNISKYSLVDILQQIGLAKGNYEYSISLDGGPQFTKTESGISPTSMESGTVEIK